MLNQSAKCRIHLKLPPSHAIYSKLNDLRINKAFKHNLPTSNHSTFPCSNIMNYWASHCFFFSLQNFPHTCTMACTLCLYIFHWGFVVSSNCKTELLTRELILVVPIPGYSSNVTDLKCFAYSWSYSVFWRESWYLWYPLPVTPQSKIRGVEIAILITIGRDYPITTIFKQSIILNIITIAPYEWKNNNIYSEII